MLDVLRPLEVMLLCFAGMLTERERAINLYLREENQILREQLGKRPRLTDDQRVRLAMLGKKIGRKLLGEWASIVTPDTILRRHRRLIAAKFDFSNRRGPGRPRMVHLPSRTASRLFPTVNDVWTCALFGPRRSGLISSNHAGHDSTA